MGRKQWARKLETWSREWRGSGSGLDRVDLAAAISEQADAMLLDAVDQARDEGASWAEVARVLDITRQTAWERFGRS